MSLANKRCLVLGAAGFIGSAICKRLDLEGAHVRRFGRAPPNPAPRESDWIVSELSDQTALKTALEGMDVVFHAAGASVPSDIETDPARDLIQNVVPTIRLMSLCSSAKVARLVYISSGGTVYGQNTQASSEISPTRPISAYGAGKLTVENYLSVSQHSYGLDYRTLRISNVFGPGQRSDRPQGLIAVSIDRISRGQEIRIWGDGSAIRDYVYIDDVVTAAYQVASYQGYERIFNIGSGLGRSVNSVVHDVAAAMAAHPRLVFEGSRQVDVDSVVLDVGLAQRELSWAPTPWSGALHHTIRQRTMAAR